MTDAAIAVGAFRATCSLLFLLGLIVGALGWAARCGASGKEIGVRILAVATGIVLPIGAGYAFLTFLPEERGGLAFAVGAFYFVIWCAGSLVGALILVPISLRVADWVIGAQPGTWWSGTLGIVLSLVACGAAYALGQTFYGLYLMSRIAYDIAVPMAFVLHPLALRAITVAVHSQAAMQRRRTGDLA
jgi:hypothetical protein